MSSRCHAMYRWRTAGGRWVDQSCMILTETIFDKESRPNSIYCRIIQGSMRIIPCKWGISSLEKGWRWHSHEACLNICAQFQEFCMSALWVYLPNSTSLMVESLYHKLYAITEVIVDLTPHRGTNKHLLRHPHCRSIPVCICFVYQCICGNKFLLNLNLKSSHGGKEQLTYIQRPSFFLSMYMYNKYRRTMTGRKKNDLFNFSDNFNCMKFWKPVLLSTKPLNKR